MIISGRVLPLYLPNGTMLHDICCPLPLISAFSPQTASRITTADQYKLALFIFVARGSSTHNHTGILRMEMPRRPAQVTQADIARVIRAAKQAGAIEVVVKVGQSLIVRLMPSTGVEVPLAPAEEIVL
jgi:hypothetical protein